MKKLQNKTKIVKVSKILRSITFAGLVLWSLLIPVSLVTAILPPLFSKGLSFSLTQFLVIPAFLFAFIANLKIFRFLDRLQNGCFFDTQTVGNLNAASNWWLILWVWEVMFFLVMQHPWSHPHDFSLYHFQPDTGGLFTALTLKFVAWFFREAQELQEEQELTV